MTNKIQITPGMFVGWLTPIRRRVGPQEFSNSREGIYWAFCPEFTAPRKVLPELLYLSSSQIKLGKGISYSKNPRVIVEVCRVGSKGQPLPSHFFGPRVSSIYKVMIDDRWVSLKGREVEWIPYIRQK